MWNTLYFDQRSENCTKITMYLQLRNRLKNRQFLHSRKLLALEVCSGIDRIFVYLLCKLSICIFKI